MAVSLDIEMVNLSKTGVRSTERCKTTHKDNFQVQGNLLLTHTDRRRGPL